MLRKRTNLNRINFKFYSSAQKFEWTSNKTREIFLNYFKEKDHEFVKPISLLNKDKNPLLVNAGMNQFKSIFLNDKKHLSDNAYLKNLTKVVNYQKCVRLSGKHNDLEEVGRDHTHHTFFEMLGNWSFNDNYFKEDACKYALDLLVNFYKIDIKRLIVTYFGGDQTLNLMEDLETKNIWLNLGLPPQKVISIEGKENFWEMSNYNGPCGPCTEIHYINNNEIINQTNVTKAELLKYSTEIWNLVFIQYERTRNGLKNLKSRHVDTGMGLERLLAILNQSESNYNTDLFLPLIQIIEQKLNAPEYTYSLSNPLDISYRIVVDHIRAICFLITDNVLPAHTNEGLLIRKLISRTIDILRNDFKDKIPKEITKLLIREVIEKHKNAYPELQNSENSILKYVFKEISRQVKSTQSTRRFLKRLKQTNQKMELDGINALKLRKKGALTKDELNRVAEEQGFSVNWNEHDKLVNEEIRKSIEVKRRKKKDEFNT